MREKGFFLRLGEAFLLGIIAIVAALVIIFLMLPYILALVIVSMALLAIFLLIWIIVYAAMMLGAAIYYAIKHPMKVSKKKKSYSISRTKEVGRREKKTG